MGRSLFLFILSYLFFSLVSTAQDTVKTAFSTKVTGGGLLFLSPTFIYPSPWVGLSGSAFINNFEIEVGVSYFRKFDEQKATNIGTDQVPVYPNYKSIFFIQDYINFHALLNIKLTQEKKHVISAYVGFNFRKNLSWSSDTLYNDGTHNRNAQVKTKATPSVGISVIGGLRYSYICNKTLNLVTGLDAGIAIEEEYYVPVGSLTPQELLYYPKPIEPKFQIGVSLGLQFMLSKKRPRFLTAR
jgi:hypothetical protein